MLRSCRPAFCERLDDDVLNPVANNVPFCRSWESPQNKHRGSRMYIDFRIPSVVDIQSYNRLNPRNMTWEERSNSQDVVEEEEEDDDDMPVIAIDNLRAIVRPDQVRNRREHVSGLVIGEPAEPLFELDEQDPILQLQDENEQQQQQQQQQVQLQDSSENERREQDRSTWEQQHAQSPTNDITASGARATATAACGVEQGSDMEMSENSDEDEVIGVIRPPSQQQQQQQQQPMQQATGSRKESGFGKARAVSSKSSSFENENTGKVGDKEGFGDEEGSDMDFSEGDADDPEIPLVEAANNSSVTTQHPVQATAATGQEQQVSATTTEAASKALCDSSTFNNNNNGDEEDALDMEISEQNPDDPEVLLVSNPSAAQRPDISAKPPQHISSRRNHDESSADDSEIAALNLQPLPPPQDHHQQGFFVECPVVSSPATSNSPNTSESSFDHDASSSKSPELKPKDRWPTSDEEKEYLDQLDDEIYLAEEREYLDELEADIVRAEQQEQESRKANRQKEIPRERNRLTQLEEQNEHTHSKRRLRVVRYYPKFLPGMSEEVLSRNEIQTLLDTLQKDHPGERPTVSLQESGHHDTWELEVRGLKAAVKCFLRHVDLNVQNKCLSCARAKLKSDGYDIEVRIKGSEKLGATMRQFRDINDQEVGLLLCGNPEGQLSRLIGQEASTYGALLLGVNGEPCGSVSDFLARIADTEEYMLTVRVSREANRLVKDKERPSLASSKHSHATQESSQVHTGNVLRPSEEADTTVERSLEAASAKEAPASKEGCGAADRDGTRNITLNDGSEPCCSRNPAATNNIEMEHGQRAKNSTSDTGSVENAGERPTDKAIPKPSANYPPPRLPSKDEGVEIEIRVSSSKPLGATLLKLNSYRFGCPLSVEGMPDSQMERLIGRNCLSSLAGVASVDDKVVHEIKEFKAAVASASSGYYRLKLVFPVDADLTGVDKEHVVYGPKRRSVVSTTMLAQSVVSTGDGGNKRKAPTNELQKKSRNTSNAPLDKPDKKKPFKGSSDDSTSIPRKNSVASVATTPSDNLLPSSASIGYRKKAAITSRDINAVAEKTKKISRPSSPGKSPCVAHAERRPEQRAKNPTAFQAAATSKGSESVGTETVALKASGSCMHKDVGVEIEIRVRSSEPLGATLLKLKLGNYRFGCPLSIEEGRPGSQMERLIGLKCLSSGAGVVSVDDKVVHEIKEFKAAVASASSGYYRLKLVFPVDADLTGVDKDHVVYGPKKRSGEGTKKRKTLDVESPSALLDNVAVPRKRSRESTNTSLIGQLDIPDKKKPSNTLSDSSSRPRKSSRTPKQSLAGGTSRDVNNSVPRHPDTDRKKAKQLPSGNQKTSKSLSAFEARMAPETVITRDEATRTSLSAKTTVRPPSLLTEESKRSKRRVRTRNVTFADDAEECFFSPQSPVTRLRSSDVKKSEETRGGTDKVGLEPCRQTYSLEQAVQDGTPDDVIACISTDRRGDSPTAKDVQRMLEVVKDLAKKATGVMQQDFIRKEKLLKILINTIHCVRQARFMKNWERFDIRFEGIKGLRLKDPTCIRDGSSLTGEVFGMQEKVEKLIDISPAALLFDESTSSYRTHFADQSFPYHMNYNPVLSDDRQMQVDLRVLGGTVPVQLGSISVKMSQLHKECPPDKKWKNIMVQAKPTNAMYGATIKISACRATEAHAVLEEKRTFWLKKLKEYLDWIKRWNQEYLSGANADNKTKLTANIKVSDNLTLLHASVFLQDYQMVEKVLEAGADPLAKSGVGSALSLAQNMADGMAEDVGEDGNTGGDDSVSHQKAGSDRKRSRRERMEKIVALLRQYSRREIRVGLNGKEGGTSEGQSNDPSSRKVEKPSSSLRVELPLLSDPSWLTNDKKKNSFCRDWEKKHRCRRDTRTCKFIHLHRPWGPRLSELLKSSMGYPLPDFDPNDIHLLERPDPSGRLWWTAGYSNATPYYPGGRDTFNQFVYYSEGGQTARISEQGISWYPSCQDAKAALYNVMVASVWAYEHGITPPEWRTSLSVSARGEQIATDPEKPAAVGYYGPTSNGAHGDSISYETKRRSSDLGYYGPSAAEYSMEEGRDPASRRLPSHAQYGPARSAAHLGTAPSVYQSNWQSEILSKKSSDLGSTGSIRLPSSDGSPPNGNGKRKQRSPTTDKKYGNAPIDLPTVEVPPVEDIWIAKLRRKSCRYFPDDCRHGIQCNNPHFFEPVPTLQDFIPANPIDLFDYDVEILVERDKVTHQTLVTAKYKDESNVTYFAQGGPGGYWDPVNNLWWYRTETDAQRGVFNALHCAKRRMESERDNRKQL